MKKLLFAVLLATAALSASAAIRAVTPAPQSTTGWWMERHQKKLAEIASRTNGIPVVFLGDSITHNWERRYSHEWSRFFGGNTPYRALNLGFGGDRTEHVLWRIANGELDGYQAKAVVLMLGTNNTGHFNAVDETPADTLCGLRAVLDAIREKQPKAKIVLCGIFPRGWTADDPCRRRNDVVNRELKQFANHRDVIWCDCGAQMLCPDGSISAEMMPDALHPASEGCWIWASAVIPYLNNALETKGPARFQAPTLPPFWMRGRSDDPVEAVAISRVDAQSAKRGGRWWMNRLVEKLDLIDRSGGSFDLVMLGDSITHFWEERHPESWASFTNGMSVLNLGGAGDKVQHALWLAENGALDGYKARNVSIMIGTNNHSGKYGSEPKNVVAGIKKLIGVVRAKQPDARIVLMPIFPRGFADEKSQERHKVPQERNVAANKMLKALADGDRIVWLDFTEKLVDPATGWCNRELMPDSIHPSAAGYAIWSAAMKPLLK